MQANKNFIVRAIDVGFCNTKYVMNSGMNGDIGCDLFPSLSPVASQQNLDVGGMLKKKNTIIAEVNGKAYEVGQDVESVIGSNYGRTMDPSFCLSDNYMAIVNGALYYMGVTDVDLLVLGLPVSSHQENKDELEERMLGLHKIGNRSIHIKKCKVLAQPVGGFFEFVSKKGNSDKFKKESNLIIDVGFYTTDWFVCNGMTPAHARCGAANNGGMGSVISNISNALSTKIKQPLDQNIYGRIDASLRSVDKKIKVYGKEHDLNEYIPVGEAAALEAINKMLIKVGNGSDIDNIILVGGGAWFFEKLVKSKFPNHDVGIASESSFSNVRGFQMYGIESMHQLNNQQRKVA